MVKTVPFMEIVPNLCCPALAATVKFTVPLPVPLAPPVMVIQESLFVAVQVQPLPEGVTVKLPVPPAIGKFWLVGDNVKVQLLP